MVQPQRLTRGFHRLAIFLGAIPLVIGLAMSIPELTKAHRNAICANHHVETAKTWTSGASGDAAKSYAFRLMLMPDDAELKLKGIGCSDWDYATIKLGDARNPQSLMKQFWASQDVLLTLLISLIVYSIVRAIGWVISGFAAS